MLREFLTRLRVFVSRKRPVDLDDELQFHLDQSTQTNVAAGMTPEEARRQAGIAFGGVERTREQCYEQRPGWLLEAVLQDVRYALRWLGRNLIFTFAVIATLALGIGATTAVFSVVDSMLLRPMPYPNSERIVRIWNTFSPRGMNEIPVSEPEFLEYRQGQSFAHVAGFSLGTVTLTGTGDPLRLPVSWGTSDFFPVLGTQPLLGRVFAAQEHQPGHTQVGHQRFGQRRFLRDDRRADVRRCGQRQHCPARRRPQSAHSCGHAGSESDDRACAGCRWHYSGQRRNHRLERQQQRTTLGLRRSVVVLRHQRCERTRRHWAPRSGSRSRPVS